MIVLTKVSLVTQIIRRSSSSIYIDKSHNCNVLIAGKLTVTCPSKSIPDLKAKGLSPRNRRSSLCRIIRVSANANSVSLKKNSVKLASARTYNEIRRLRTKLIDREWKKRTVMELTQLSFILRRFYNFWDQFKKIIKLRSDFVDNLVL